MESSTFLGPTKKVKVILLSGFALIGFICGYFAVGMSEWVLRLSWIPYQRLLEVLHKLLLRIQPLIGEWMTVVLGGAGACIGLLIAFLLIDKILCADISDQEIILYKDKRTYKISKADVQYVFLDGDELVILACNGHELLREPHHLKETIVEDAFVFHRYPWEPGRDPYEVKFQLWTPDEQEIPKAAHALLNVRKKALEYKDEEEAAKLRKELADWNIIVRTKGTKQYWRFAVGNDGQRAENKQHAIWSLHK